MPKLRTFLIALALPFAAAVAYPIAPRTLPRQLRDADAVVLAKVVSIDEPTSREAFANSTANLEVLETWKGQVPGQLAVAFEEHLICPAPARFVVGETVLTFLRRSDRGWTPVALSYGTLYPDADELPVLRDVAQRFSRLPANDEAYSDFLVTLACNRATRWDALFELAPEGDELHAYYARGEAEQKRPRLTPQQLARVADCFVQQPTGDQTLPMVLHLLEGHPSPAFDRTVAGVIEALLAVEPLPWWTSDAISAAVARLAPEKMQPGGEQSRLRGMPDEDGRAARVRWQQVRPKLNLGPIPKVKLPGFGAPGTGKRTPS